MASKKKLLGNLLYKAIQGVAKTILSSAYKEYLHKIYDMRIFYL